MWLRLPPWWFKDIVIVALIGGSLALVQTAIDDARSNREDRREDLRFIRDRSSGETIERPFRNMDLSEQNLAGLQLNGADFQSAKMTRADLAFADLSGANLFGANLDHATAGFAILSGTNLAYARLAGTSLTYADLSGADLLNADLSGADLSGADLSRAILTNATLTSVKLDGICYDWLTVWPEGFTAPASQPDKCLSGEDHQKREEFRNGRPFG